MSDEKTTHSTNDLWKRINQQSDQISSLATAQAKTDEQLQGLIATVDSGFARTESAVAELAHRLNKPAQPFNWFGLVASFVGLVSLMGSFVILNTNPISDRVDMHFTAISKINEDLSQRAYRFGVIDAENARQQQWVSNIETQLDIERARNADIEERVSRMEGRHQMLVDRVKDIDDKGSRRWNEGRPE